MREHEHDGQSDPPDAASTRSGVPATTSMARDHDRDRDRRTEVRLDEDERARERRRRARSAWPSSPSELRAPACAPGSAASQSASAELGELRRLERRRRRAEASGAPRSRSSRSPAPRRGGRTRLPEQRPTGVTERRKSMREQDDEHGESDERVERLALQVVRRVVRRDETARRSSRCRPSRARRRRARA